MNNKIKAALVVAVILMLGCNHKQQAANGITISPDAGTSYNEGQTVTVKLNIPNGTKIDSVVYLLDSVKLVSRKDSAAISFKTDTMPCGIKMITAEVYHSGQSQDINTNIVLYAAKPPQAYTYTVEKVYPHDTSCYTEGLLYHDGYLYESGGGYLNPPDGMPSDGQSSLRKVDLNTGRVVKKVMLDPKVFGEGISIVGNKIIQLTWTSKIGYVYDLNSFKLLYNFTNNIGVEGWGMCFDGKKLYMDDSTNRIWLIDKDKWRPIGYIDVYDDSGPVDSINELEYIDGKIYANVYQTNDIIVIDPKTGSVLEKIDLTNLYPEDKRAPNANVLNGIAYDAENKRIFITGKKWPHLYQVKFMKK